MLIELALDRSYQALKIVQLIDQYHLVLVNEASILTPIRLVSIDLRLRQCFNADGPFGSKHILLCGDMRQFTPVSSLAKPVINISAVVVSANMRIPNALHRAGVNLFTHFRLFVLNNHQRCEPYSIMLGFSNRLGI